MICGYLEEGHPRSRNQVQKAGHGMLYLGNRKRQVTSEQGK